MSRRFLFAFPWYVFNRPVYSILSASLGFGHALLVEDVTAASPLSHGNPEINVRSEV